MKDFLGTPISVGDLIAYAWRRGSAMGLRKATVTSVFANRLHILVDGENRTIKTSSNIVVLAKPTGAPSNADLSA